jgi:hypothetical protein
VIAVGDRHRHTLRGFIVPIPSHNPRDRKQVDAAYKSARAAFIDAWIAEQPE